MSTGRLHAGIGQYLLGCESITTAFTTLSFFINIHLEDYAAAVACENLNLNK